MSKSKVRKPGAIPPWNKGARRIAAPARPVLDQPRPNRGTAPCPRFSGRRCLPEKIKELVRLAQEQGHLTYNDINDVLPDNVTDAGDTGRGFRQAAQPGN